MYLNGFIQTLWSILKHTVSSAEEAELGVLFTNAREVKIKNSHLKKWAIRSHKPLSIVTITMQPVSALGPLNDSDQE